MSSQPLNAPNQKDAALGVLQFSDSTSCKRWIESLPLLDIQKTQLTLTAQLATLSATQLPALERLQILELLKNATVFVQEESAKLYAGKPLPLNAEEAAAWRRGIDLWQETGRNYQQCLDAYRDGDLSIAPHAALVCMRCLQYVGATILDHYRTYREVGGALWHSLHALYAFAEQHGFARIGVKDIFSQRDSDSSCDECYLQTLLLQLANPYALSVRQMGFTQRWLKKWAALVGLVTQPLPPSAIPSLTVDLSGASAITLAATQESQATVRYLDLEQLSKTLRLTINLLKQNQTPEQLGLGNDARQPGCENLLMLLYLQWCRAGTVRQEVRQDAPQPARVCFGIPAAHFHLSGGRDFRQPGELTSRERQDLDTYGEIVSNVQNRAAPDDAKFETCQILNNSTSGFMCLQRNLEGRQRVSHNQFITVGTGSNNFRTGIVQWRKQEDNGELFFGVRLFPGIPESVAARPANPNSAGSNRYERALLLPKMALPPTSATVILPHDWFESGRIIELYTDHKLILKLVSPLEKGYDFDRCTFTTL